MHFAVLAASAALVAGVSAGYANVSAVYTTVVVDDYVTYCPYATSFTAGSQTFTVTEATTITILNCSCTVTKPVYTSSSVYCSTCPTSTPAAAPLPVTSYTPSAAPYPYSSAVAPSYVNSTGPLPPSGTATPSGTSAPSASAPVSTAAAATFTGAANKAFVASGAGLAGLLGFAAYVL